MPNTVESAYTDETAGSLRLPSSEHQPLTKDLADLSVGDLSRLLTSQTAQHVSFLGTFQVLLVEDCVQQQQQVAELFAKANSMNAGAITFELTIAGSAAEAVRAVGEPRVTNFHLVLLDLLLPDMNGFDVLPELKERCDPECAIVVASAFAELSLVQLCVRRGADAFLPKPLQIDDIRNCWQFIHDLALPEGSFRDELSAHRSNADRSSQQDADRGNRERDMAEGRAGMTTRNSNRSPGVGRSNTNTSNDSAGSVYHDARSRHDPSDCESDENVVVDCRQH